MTPLDYQRRAEDYEGLLREHWPRRVAERLRSVAGAITLSSTLLSAGCGDGHRAEERPPETELTVEQRFEASEYARLPGMVVVPCNTLADPISLERAEALALITNDDVVVASRGTLCASAADRAACEAPHLQARRPRSEHGHGPVLLMSRGDVGEALVRYGLVEALGPVDSIEYAALVLFMNEDVACGPRARLRRNGDAFQYAVWRSPTSCNDDVELHELDVHGALRLVGRQPLREPAPGCVVVEEPVEGRRPCGLVDLHGVDHVGGYLARMAYYEEASVAAFDELAAQLASVGAPANLVAACRVAAREEVRHAELTGALARRYGGTVPAQERRPPDRPTLLAMALDNAREGCANETYSALSTSYQAEHALLSDVRGLMAEISRDEISHAVLSHALARWMDEKLDAGARASVEQARRSRLRGLAAAERHPATDRMLGKPPARLRSWMLGTIAELPVSAG